MRAHITFDRPWDRRALDQRRPQPRLVDLHLAEAIWGDLQFNLSADLTVDAQGVPAGTVAIQAENWRTMLDLAQTAGLLPVQLRDQAENILQALANASGNTDTLDVAIGPVAVGSAVGGLPSLCATSRVWTSSPPRLTRSATPRSGRPGGR